MTGDIDCLVRIRLINSVQLNMRIAVTSEEFWGDHDKHTQFIDRIASFLQIPSNRIKIVGIAEIKKQLRML